MKTTSKLLGMCLLVALCACGGGDTNSPNGDDNGDAGSNSQATTFDCYATNGCSSDTQYCLLSTQNGINMGGMCASFASGCHTCDCATDQAASDWAAENPDTNNCSPATIVCSQSDAVVRVTCKK